MLQAVEFFSGIGAFAVAAHRFDINIVAAFDQSEKANETYKLNFGRSPNARNLDSISASDIPQADMWWLSPPCTPFSVRGKQKDASDPRAKSFLNLIGLIGSHRPRYLAVENVLGFVGSDVQATLLQVLAAEGYAVSEFNLCSTELGTPMRRPRHFALAWQSPLTATSGPGDRAQFQVANSLGSFLGKNSIYSDDELRVSEQEIARYGASYDIVDPLDDNAVAICFTSGYGKSQKVSGSLIKADGALRRFAPEEILALLGFPESYKLPKDLTLQSAWRLAGNSIDVRCVEFCLRNLLGDHIGV